MINRPNTNAQRLKRHKRVRGKISGTPERPRLNVFRSKTNIYAQIIDDVTGKTLVSASSLEKGFEGNGGNVCCQEGRSDGGRACQGCRHRHRGL
jgi:large subunit ribosomal protein L18